MTASASRVIALPTTFVTTTTVAPRSSARRSGASVSAVSPDWLTPMTSVRSSIGGGLYRISEPTCIVAGSPTQSWIR